MSAATSDHHTVEEYLGRKNPADPLQKVRHCCSLECGKPAVFTIVFGCGPDDYTDACVAHLGEMVEWTGETHCDVSVISKLEEATH